MEPKAQSEDPVTPVRTPGVLRPGQRRWRMAALGLLVLGLPAIAGGVGWVWSFTAGIAELRRDAASEIEFLIARVETPLAKFKELPRVLADTGRFAEVLAARDEISIQSSNDLLERLANVTGASDIYLLDGAGTTVSASNWAKPWSFVGRNYAYRPYFTRAMEGALGRYYALGTASKRRGFYFAVPIDVQTARLGVLTVKVDVEEIEEAAFTGPEIAFFTDPRGVIFLASRPDLLYRPLAPLSAAETAQIRRDRQYDGASLAPLPPLQGLSLAGARTIDTAPWRDANAAIGEAILTTRPVSRLDLTAHLLTPTAPVREAASLRRKSGSGHQ